jgi:hypothetical protein
MQVPCAVRALSMHTPLLPSTITHRQVYGATQSSPGQIIPDFTLARDCAEVLPVRTWRRVAVGADAGGTMPVYGERSRAASAYMQTTVIQPLAPRTSSQHKAIDPPPPTQPNAPAGCDPHWHSPQAVPPRSACVVAAGVVFRRHHQP